MSALGYCYQYDTVDEMGRRSMSKCPGPLCTQGTDIVCEQCGLPHPDHPLAVEARERREKILTAGGDPNCSGKPILITPADMSASWVDRIRTLEGQVAELTALLSAQTQRLAALESDLSPPAASKRR